MSVVTGLGLGGAGWRGSQKLLLRWKCSCGPGICQTVEQSNFRHRHRTQQEHPRVLKTRCELGQGVGRKRAGLSNSEKRALSANCQDEHKVSGTSVMVLVDNQFPQGPQLSNVQPLTATPGLDKRVRWRQWMSAFSLSERVVIVQGDLRVNSGTVFYSEIPETHMHQIPPTSFVC
jgi:hypothetical protein